MQNLRGKGVPQVPPPKGLRAVPISYLIINSVGGRNVQVVYTFNYLKERGVERAQLKIKNYFPDWNSTWNQPKDEPEGNWNIKKGISRKSLQGINFYQFELLSSLSNETKKIET